MTTSSGVSTLAVHLRLAAQAILSRRPFHNHARPLAGVLSGLGGRPSLGTVARSCAVGRARAGAWVAREGGAEAVAAAGRLSGRGSWQVTQLLAHGDAESAAERVLERVSAEAGRSGAQRVFLRLPVECDLLGAARRAGYFPVYHETLLVGARPNVPTVGAERRGTAPREASRQDEYDLFRLYSAAAPSEVRRMAGVTFDQWRDSRERGPGRAREFVLESERGLAGRLRVGRGGPNGWLDATCAPGSVDAARSLVCFGLERLAGARRIRALVAEFQPDVLSAMRGLGFAPGPEYVMCIRTTASPVRLASGAEAPA